jgi:NADH-quinone oxidoreductase subunit L
MLIGTLAIAGIPPLAGFVSKDAILWEAWAAPSFAYHLLWIIGYVTAIMTAFYMFRLIYLTFFGEAREPANVQSHIHESPRSMTVPLIILAAGSIFAGFLGWPRSLLGGDWFSKFLNPVFATEAGAEMRAEGERGQLQAARKEEEHTNPKEYLLMFLSVGAALAGWGLARRAYGKAREGYSEPIATYVPPVYTTLLNKYYVDEAYDYAFTGRRKLGKLRLGAMGLGTASWKFDANAIDGAVNGTGWGTRITGVVSSWFDKWIIDGVFVNGLAILTRMASIPVRLVQWGLVQFYAFVMVVGIVGFILYYVWR